MQAILSGKLSVWICLIFPVLAVSGFLMEQCMQGMRKELEMARYIAERGEIEQAPPLPDAKDLLPGYTMLTRQDYDEILQKLRQELGLQNP